MESFDLSDRTTLRFVLFGLTSVLLFLFLQLTFWKHQPWRLLTVTVWAGLPVVFVGGWIAMGRMEARERQRMAGLLQGYAPVFASAMEAAGHAQLTSIPDREDPAYLRLIEMEKRWLAANPSVVDIFTLRRSAAGGWQLLVDSETDYDKNGVIEGDRERRSPPGEIIQSPEVAAGAGKVMATNSSYLEPRVYTDRWGKWISTYAPMIGADGKVEGVLGVDLRGQEWEDGIRMARGTCLNYCALIIFGLCGLMTMASMTTIKADSRSQGEEARRAASARDRIDALLNSIDGVVYELDLRTGKWLYVSRQVQSMLGYTPGAFTGDPGFWHSRINPEHRKAVERASAQSCTLEYQALSSDGTFLWIRDSAVCTDQNDQKIVRGVLLDITSERDSADELARVNRQLVDSSRQAGMAEVATGVLHNVGNVLNTVNVAGNLMQECVRSSALPGLNRLAVLMTSKGDALLEFLMADPQGRNVSSYLAQLSDTLNGEQTQLCTELATVSTGIRHLREIVSTQQGYARHMTALEEVDLTDILDDAIRLAIDPLEEKSLIRVVRDVSPVTVRSDRHRVLQILINLLRNAREAVRSRPFHECLVTVTLQPGASGMLDIRVTDNGMGIPRENLTRIFSHGFTTRRDGHGFGLHTSALAARTLGGQLTARSDGPGCGATFILTLPSVIIDPALPASTSQPEIFPTPANASA